MPNSTPETRKDIREVYNQVPKGIRLMSEAVPHLLAILGLPASDKSEGIKSRRTAVDVQRISDTLTEQGYGNFEQTKEYDDPKSKEIARHIIDLTTRYPFLGCSKKASEEGISNKELAEELISNADTCLYSNFSGLYGITNLQGQQLRGSIQSPHDSSRLTVGDVEDLIREARQKLAAENEPEQASNFDS